MLRCNALGGGLSQYLKTSFGVETTLSMPMTFFAPLSQYLKTSFGVETMAHAGEWYGKALSQYLKTSFGVETSTATSALVCLGNSRNT